MFFASRRRPPPLCRLASVDLDNLSGDEPGVAAAKPGDEIADLFRSPGASQRNRGQTLFPLLAPGISVKRVVAGGVGGAGAHAVHSDAVRGQRPPGLLGEGVDPDPPSK